MRLKISFVICLCFSINYCKSWVYNECPNNLTVTKPVEEVTRFLCYHADTKEYNEIFLNDWHVELNQKINLFKNVSFLIHGYNGNGAEGYLADISKDWVEFSDCNVCIVDWGLSSYFDYGCKEAFIRIYNVAYYTKLVINLLAANGVPIEFMSLAGHSLGAHVAGIIGSLLNGTVGIIYGLDPPGICFTSMTMTHMNCRLDSSDARWVQVIHSCGMEPGTFNQLGHQDFYPNGALMQPACWRSSRIFSSQIPFFACNHFMAAFYFQQSLKQTSKCTAHQCKSYLNYQMSWCEKNPTDYIGPRNSKVPGIFYLNTNANQPYC